MNMQLDLWEIRSCVYSEGPSILVYSRQFLICVDSHVGCFQFCVAFPLVIFIRVWKWRSCGWITASLMTQRRSDSTSWHIFWSFLHSYEWDFV